LSEDFHLDSLGRVQLAAALEERMTDAPKEGAVDAARTLRDLRSLITSTRLLEPAAPAPHGSTKPASDQSAKPLRDDEIDLSGVTSASNKGQAADLQPLDHPVPDAPKRPEFIYPRWPWSPPFQWLRSAFLELIAQPLVWLLGNPRVISSRKLLSDEPLLIICNHVTAYDGALVEYALPGGMRRRVASAMQGEMLEDFRHFRNPDTGKFMLFGPAAYWLVTALYNVFPLPRRRDFQRSFAHAGEALDRDYNVLVFPEGTRSAVGELAPFRPGIGLLVKQAHAPVLPVALIGLSELKAQGRGWFRSGKLEIRVGEPLHFGPLDTEAAITETLHQAVSALMTNRG
jgi:long-chain acyl-CoA synthetase